MALKSKILIIGGTGYIGKYVVAASAKAGHPTFALVPENRISDPKRAAIKESFKRRSTRSSQLVNAIKQVDIVISKARGDLVAHQVKIIAAIKEAGNIKRFLPSDFGSDVDPLHGFVEPAASLYRTKAEIRRAVEAEGIPYTYLVSNGFAGYLNYFLNPFADSSSASPPRDKIVILGDGNPKVVFSKEEDIAAYTIKAADDPRTLNKIVYIRPPAEASMPLKFILSLGYTVLVKGEMANFEIEASFGMEATELYPDVKCTALDEHLNQFV